MIIKRILLNNAGPFLSEWEVELPLGVTAVVADYDDAPARSNRAGKSFVAVDAPRYALDGEFRGKTDDFVHRLVRGKEAGFVELEVESSEGRTFVIRRGRDKSGDPIRRLDGANVSERDLERVVLEEIRGLSAEEYLLTNAFVQGDMHAFMKMTPAEKRRVVSPWFQTDRWVPRAELARLRLTKAQTEMRALDAAAERCREFVADAEEVRSLARALEAERAEAGEVYVRAMEERAAAKAALDLVAEARTGAFEARKEVGRLEEELEEERARLTSELINADRDAKRARADLEAAGARKEEVARLEREVAATDELRQTVAEVTAALNTARGERETAERVRAELLEKYRELETNRTGTCPVLREACDRIASDPAVMNDLKVVGLSRRREITRLGTALDALGWKLDMARADLAGAVQSEQGLAKIRGEVTVAQAEHAYEAAKRAQDAAEAAASNAKIGKTETGKALARAKRALGKVGPSAGDAPERRLAAAVEELEVQELAVKEVEQRHNIALSQLDAQDRARAELEEIAGRRKVLRSLVENLAWASYAFGASGIPSRELENAFGVAEDAMNSVLSDLQTSLRLRFSPTRELKDWEAGCLACGWVFTKGTRKHVCRECGTPRRKRRRDELRLEVLDGDQESTFELDSGGGKILLSVGGRLGLSSIPGSSRRVRCEHLLMDEPDGALDEPNRRALYGILRDRLPDLGVRQAIFITHTDVREQFDSVVTVRRWAGEDRSGVWND